MSESKPTLEELRAALDEHDRRLIEMVGRRMELVRQIGEVKRADGRGTFDRGREREVIARARSAAERSGVDPALGETILTTLIEASQQEQQAAAAASDGLHGRRALVIGGRGKMATRLMTLLGWPAAQVTLLDRGDRIEPETVVAADVVMLAAPLETLGGIAADVAPLVRADALLFDIGSLKSEVCRIFKQRCAAECLGLHPVFGPTISSLRRQKIVVCPVREGPLSKALIGELTARGAELVVSEPERHDRMMGAVQVLIHFSKFVVGSALRRSGISLADTLDYTSPVYRLELIMIGRMFAQSARLYGSIQIDNPHAAEVRALFTESARELAEIVAREDLAAFEARFAEVSGYFSAFSQEALGMSDKLIDYLVARA